MVTHVNDEYIAGYLTTVQCGNKVIKCRNNAKVFKMQRGAKGHLGKENKKKIQLAKLDVQDRARKPPLSMRIDFPDESGCGGNTDTSQIARRFFTEKNREGVVALFDPPEAESAEQFRADVSELHRKISIFLRVMMSRRKVSS